jgi:hypothetical protein
VTTTENRLTVISALELEVSTRTQRGKLALVSRKLLAWRAPMPLRVASAKKSHTNRPMMRLMG